MYAHMDWLCAMCTIESSHVAGSRFLVSIWFVFFFAAATQPTKMVALRAVATMAVSLPASRSSSTICFLPFIYIRSFRGSSTLYSICSH